MDPTTNKEEEEEEEGEEEEEKEEEEEEEGKHIEINVYVLEILSVLPSYAINLFFHGDSSNTQQALYNWETCEGTV